MEFLKFFWSNYSFDVYFLTACAVLCGYLKRKKHFALRLAACLVALFAFATVWPYLPKIIPHPAVRVFYFYLQYLLVFASLKLCFDCSVYAALYAVTSAYCMQHFVETLSRIVRRNFDFANFSWQNILVRTLLTFFFYAIVYFLIVRKNKTWMKKIYIESIPQLVVAVFATMLTIVIDICFPRTDSMLVSNVFSGIMLSYTLMLFLYEYNLLSKGKIMTDNKLLKEQLRQEREHYKEDKTAMEMVNIKCHDIRHQVRAMKGTISEQAIHELTDAIRIYDSIVTTGNEAIDIALARYVLYCRNNKIKFTCLLDGKALNFMPDHELYALFGNAMENAVHAVAHVDDEKKIISITGSCVGNLFNVSISNYYSSLPQFKDGLPLPKEKEYVHGFGVRSMKLLVEKYGGRLNISLKDDLFILNIFFPLEIAKAKK